MCVCSWFASLYLRHEIVHRIALSVLSKSACLGEVYHPLYYQSTTLRRRKITMVGVPIPWLVSLPRYSNAALISLHYCYLSVPGKRYDYLVIETSGVSNPESIVRALDKTFGKLTRARYFAPFSFVWFGFCCRFSSLIIAPLSFFFCSCSVAFNCLASLLLSRYSPLYSFFLSLSLFFLCSFCM